MRRRYWVVIGAIVVCAWLVLGPPRVKPLPATSDGHDAGAGAGASPTVATRAPVAGAHGAASTPSYLPVARPTVGDADVHAAATRSPRSVDSRGAEARSSDAMPAGARDADRTAGPKYWRLVGSPPFDVRADTSNAFGGAYSLRVSMADASSPGAFGGAKQLVDAASFRGRRIRFTAHSRTSGSAQATIGLSALDANGVQLTPKFMLVDARRQPPIRDAAAWTAYAEVVDIPSQATYVEYGVFLLTPGTVWFDSTALDVVDGAVPTTQPPGIGPPYASPPGGLTDALPGSMNLDFEEWETRLRAGGN